MSVRTGFDTGFFVLLGAEEKVALKTWDQAASGERDGYVSVITLFELDRLGLRGALPAAFVEQALESIPDVCEVIPVADLALIRQCAKLAQGLGLSLADALILGSFKAVACDEVFTTDRDLERSTGRRPRIRLLG